MIPGIGSVLTALESSYASPPLQQTHSDRLRVIYLPDAAKLQWSDVELIILDEHRQHRSYEKVERHVRRHLRRHFTGERATGIAYDRLLRFKQARLAEQASPSTVRYELSLIRTGLV